jgi:hypothetical protein
MYHQSKSVSKSQLHDNGIFLTPLLLFRKEYHRQNHPLQAGPERMALKKADLL